MKVLFISQVNDFDSLSYRFEGEKIIATLNGVTDVIDFTGMPDGVATSVTSTLKYNPVKEARRENGELYVKLLNFISKDAPDEEKFPEWREV